MRKANISLILSALVLSLSVPLTGLAQGYDTNPTPKADTSKGHPNPEVHPATKAMDKASPDKAVTPGSGSTGSKDALPATKSMDKALSPDKAAGSGSEKK